MSKEKSVKRELISLLIYIIIVFCLAGLLRTFVIQRTLVDGHSMENTLQDKDQLIIDKLSYHFKAPKRFDIIVFPYQYDESTHYIKRVIGLPGETVLITGNTIYINGSPLEENYGKEAMDEGTSGIAQQEIVLSDNEYFVLGDNRNNSTDSRSEDVGPIKREDIIGRAFLRVWPMKNFKVLD